MTSPAKALFVPAAQAPRVDLEPRTVTTAGHVSAWGVRATFPLDRYHRRHQITTRQYHAGLRLYEDYALGPCGARQPPEHVGVSEPGRYEDARLDACRRYRTALQRVGKRLAWLVVAVACEDQLVAHLARDHGRNVTELMGLLKVALDMVGDAYGLDD
jgi:hypothetical protein